MVKFRQAHFLRSNEGKEMVEKWRGNGRINGPKWAGKWRLNTKMVKVDF